MVRPLPEELPIHGFLRKRLQEGFGGVLSRLAEACEVSPSMASKWVSEEPDRRRRPSSGSCLKIAAGLGVDADYVLQLAGHRGDDSTVPDEPPALAALIAVLRRSWPSWGETEQRVITLTARALGDSPRGFTSYNQVDMNKRKRVAWRKHRIKAKKTEEKERTGAVARRG